MEQVTSASGAALPKWLEFNSNTNTLQGLPVAGEGGVYLLSITASGGIHAQQTPGAAANFTIHVQDSSLSLEESLNHMPNSYQCGQEVAITSAELILSTGAASLDVQGRLHLVQTMAEYLRLDPSLLSLLPFPAPAPRGSQGPTLLAEHLEHTGNHHTGLSWPVRCGAFAALREFIQVLQRNAESQLLSELLGCGIAGWRILRTGEEGRKAPRGQRRRLMITPTPTVTPLRITPTAAGGAPRPWAFPVPSPLLTPLVAPPAQSLSPFCGESATTASYKMQNNIHLAWQESSVTSETHLGRDVTTNPPVSMMFAGSNSPDLSPSLIPETRFLFTELEVLPTRASGASLLLEQLEPHMPETDLYFLSSKSEIPTYHLLQDITADTDQISRPNTLHEQLHSSAKAFPPKTHFRGFLREAMSVSEVPDYSDKAKSHFPDLQMLPCASLSPETLGPEASPSFPGMLTSTVTSEAASVSHSGTEEFHSDKDLGTTGVLPNVTKPTLESHKTSDIKPDAVEVLLMTLFNATSHQPSSTPGGLTAWESFTIELMKPTSIPCHLYTIRTRNSYYSFLRERTRVSLFLEKLSLYLNSSSPQDLVVATLQPSSTIISWYNRSLCARSNGSAWCARDEIQGALEKLQVPGGHISPRFVQAMLPEYKVDVIFSISYSDLCSATMRPFHGAPSSAVPVLETMNSNTTRESPPVLLSSLCATVGVVLGILLCWLWKCARIPASQCVLFQRSSQLSCAGVELDVLKPRKAPVHECRASAPAPPLIPLTSQNQHPRAIPVPHTTPPCQPPKYQLPPWYGQAVTTHHSQGNK
ncbi:hypothetical protein WISP_30707 [Willisornis vidua]|uniref:Peptidase S72 domain-containing protein n=1 Tax=Willisornis vidua TaxID=1566151 RepID=A0ABQ9DLK1_9PASS|nr:hypothetical protein WISP_30707 [Willisornis vidua]